MALSYPRAQTLIIAIVCAAAVGGALYYSRSSLDNGSTEAAIQATADANLPDQSSTSTPDISQSDDWKKEFSSTTSAFAKASRQQATTSENLTLTDQVGRDFLLSYIQLKQADLLQSTDTVSQTMGDILDNRLNSIKPRTYALSDLAIADAAGTAGLATYSANLERVVETYHPPQSEAVIVTNYLNDNDPTELKAVDGIIHTYKDIVSSLVAMQVPRQMAADHLSVINAFSALESAALDLRLLDTDAVRGMAGTTAHSDAVSAVWAALRGARSTLAGYGVGFSIHPDVLSKLIQ